MHNSTAYVAQMGDCQRSRLPEFDSERQLHQSPAQVSDLRTSSSHDAGPCEFANAEHVSQASPVKLGPSAASQSARASPVSLYSVRNSSSFTVDGQSDSKVPCEEIVPESWHKVQAWIRAPLVTTTRQKKRLMAGSMRRRGDTSTMHRRTT